MRRRVFSVILTVVAATLWLLPAARGGGPPTPANDRCSGAEVIPGCGPFPKLSGSASLAAATAAEDPVPACQKSVAGGVWYAFAPTTTGEYTITTCQDRAPGTTTPDTVLALFNTKDNQCPASSQAGCNDDDAACPDHAQQATVTASLVAGKTYFILAYAKSPVPPGAAVQVAVLRKEDPLNGGFETGDLTGWQVAASEADVAVVAADPTDPRAACFRPDMPSEGCYMACLSTGTFFGGKANGHCPGESAGSGDVCEQCSGCAHDGVRSDMVSGPIMFAFKPDSITVSFTVEFQTQESLSSLAFNDAFQARLITPAGTFVMLQVDTFGRTTPGRGLGVQGFTEFVDSPPSPACALEGGQRTRRLTVTWTKPVDAVLRPLIGLGPVHVEFSISDQGSPERASIACVDAVTLKIGRR